MEGYAAVLPTFGIMVGVVGLIYAANLALTLRRDPLRAQPYLGGAVVAEHAFSRFHPRWYVVSMIFLAFDMEMLFMYPWTLVVRRMGAPSVIEMFTFLTLLMAGVVYAWREGGLRWT